MDKNGNCKLVEFRAKDVEGMVPMVELLCRAERTVDEFIDAAGRTQAVDR